MGENLEFRKGTVKIRLTDSSGKPLAHQRIQAVQKNHAFLFGCNAFDAVPLCAPDTDPARRAVLEERMSLWLKLFNFATLPFYWGRYEPERGKPHQEELMAAARFLKERGVKIKGHPLCWHTVTAPWLLELSNQEILEAQLDRIRRDVTAFQGIVDAWDVINEAVIMPAFDKYDNGITRICKEMGRIPLIRKVFEEAGKASPDTVFLINDFNTTWAYEILIEGCLEAGIPIKVIGIQSHQHQGYWGKDKLLEILERFSRFGLPIHFTENTLISGHLMPPEIEDLNDYQIPEWPTTPEGEERQARETIEMYSILFSHPMVQAVTTWDFDDDNKWLGAPCGLVRKDNSPKPVYHELDRKINEEWKTQKDLVTDENGEALLHGFRGEYQLSWEQKHEKIKVGDTPAEFVWEV